MNPIVAIVAPGNMGAAVARRLIEQRKGALIHFLSAFDFIDLYPIEPLSLKSYRQALYPSGAHSDPVDAVLLAEFLLKHHARLRCYRPQQVEFRDLVPAADGFDQRVFVLGPDGRAYLAHYLMQRQGDGGWKINGCILEVLDDRST